MKAGTAVAFGAGVLVCMIVVNDGFNEAFATIAAVGSVAMTFAMGVLGPLPPILAALIVLGVGLIVGRNMAERGRARKDADDAWNKRKVYRGG